MQSNFYQIDESWPGRLAVAPRPRGGDWLANDITSWRRSGINDVVSLLTRSEEKDLDLQQEAAEVRVQGMGFMSFPIADRQTPTSEEEWAHILEDVSGNLAAGRNVLVHCRQGIGRSGLLAVCLLVKKGLSPGAAVELVSSARGLPVPETYEQRQWIDQYAASLIATK